MNSPVAPATPGSRRLRLLSPGATRNGVDFARVRPGHPAQIEVHFLNCIRVRGTLARSRAPVTITGGEAPRGLIVPPINEAAAWSTDTSGRPVLHLTVDLPAAAARYILTVYSDQLDPRLQQAVVTVGPPSGCRTGPPAEPRPGRVAAVTVDYLAKDFQSFCAALSDFSTVHYPQWIERSEADLGVMLMEALSALADELSYQQDRVAAEATLDTATQPLSLLRHARLVDYEPAQPMAATTLLQVDVAGPFSGTVHCQAVDEQGQAVDFVAGPASLVSPTWAPTWVPVRCPAWTAAGTGTGMR